MIIAHPLEEYPELALSEIGTQSLGNNVHTTHSTIVPNKTGCGLHGKKFRSEFGVRIFGAPHPSAMNGVPDWELFPSEGLSETQMTVLHDQ